MLPFFSEWYGNPANGLHRQGRFTARAVDNPRGQVAELIGSQADEVFFTTGPPKVIIWLYLACHFALSYDQTTSALES